MKKTDHLAEARKSQKAKEEKLHVASSLKQALRKIDELEAHVEAIKILEGSQAPLIIKPRERAGRSEATAFAIATDWHVGSTVHANRVNGLNAYNVAIARARVQVFFENVVRLTDKERQNVAISELVLFLGGDLIEGALHLDTIMGNEIGEPIEQAVVVQDLVEGGLNFLLNHGKFKNIVVVCADGNHGRITTKQHWTTRKGNSLEWYLYYNISHRFPQIQWRMAHGLHEYLHVYDKTVRFHHGDTIGFGGMNGPFTMLNRKHLEWNEAIAADYSVQGHLHQYIAGGRRWIVNGSLVGYTAYGQSLGGMAQPPIQAFFLIDKKRGLTVQIPILA